MFIGDKITHGIDGVGGVAGEAMYESIAEGGHHISYGMLSGRFSIFFDDVFSHHHFDIIKIILQIKYTLMWCYVYFVRGLKLNIR